MVVAYNKLQRLFIKKVALKSSKKQYLALRIDEKEKCMNKIKNTWFGEKRQNEPTTKKKRKI